MLDNPFCCFSGFSGTERNLFAISCSESPVLILVLEQEFWPPEGSAHV